MESPFRITHFPNNIRVLSEHIPHVRSVSLGIWVLTGLQHEDAHYLAGITHFIEHMLFRGTKNRSAQALAHDFESIGAYIEAFTTREYTCFHARFLDSHLTKVVELLADLVNQPQFMPEDIEKEKQVICEELRMFENSPADVAREVLCQLIWSDYYLGKPILGTKESITGFNADLVRNHWRKNYATGRVVIAAAGYIEHEQLTELVEKAFTLQIMPPTTPSTQELNSFRRLTQFRTFNSTQAHLCLGTRVMSQYNEDRIALYLLTTILANSMNSRLYRALREKDALVYSIGSVVDLYRESGIFCVHMTLDAKNAQQALNTTINELFWLTQGSITADELDSAKNQHKMNTMISLEIVSNRMRRIATQEINHLRYFSMDEMLQSIDKVTVDQINAIAARIANDKNLSLVTVGPPELQTISF